MLRKNKIARANSFQRNLLNHPRLRAGSVERRRSEVRAKVHSRARLHFSAFLRPLQGVSAVLSTVSGPIDDTQQTCDGGAHWSHMSRGGVAKPREGKQDYIVILGLFSSNAKPHTLIHHHSSFIPFAAFSDLDFFIIHFFHLPSRHCTPFPSLFPPSSPPSVPLCFGGCQFLPFLTINHKVSHYERKYRGTAGLTSWAGLHGNSCSSRTQAPKDATEFFRME